MKALIADYQTAPISEADRTMLDYAVKLTQRPWEIKKEDIDALRLVGFDDTAILDICQIVGYYNFVNRLADGLGVELEDYWSKE
ncbi:MAG: peroxidase [candidate division Zixibacteria bacterium]|nr:peroxidase [candidate division Zixibacteria bacterium]